MRKGMAFRVYCCCCCCTAVGFVMGMAFGVLTRLLLRYMRYMGAGHDQEVALTLGMAYLAYWITAMPCKGSGAAGDQRRRMIGYQLGWLWLNVPFHRGRWSAGKLQDSR